MPRKHAKSSKHKSLGKSRRHDDDQTPAVDYADHQQQVEQTEDYYCATTSTAAPAASYEYTQSDPVNDQ